MGADRAMPAARMHVEEFLAWTLDRPGRYECVEGEVLAMSPHRGRQVEAKAAAFLALGDAVRRSGISCRAMADGMTVRLGSANAYEPDAVACRGPRLPEDAIEMRDPEIVLEVISPGTGNVDTGRKFAGYFSLSSIAHDLIVDPDKHTVIHQQRGDCEVIATRIMTEGRLALDPPFTFRTFSYWRDRSSFLIRSH